MEPTAYAELKSTRDAARTTVSNLREAVRYLKYAARNLKETAPEAAESIIAQREALKVTYGEAITAKEALEAQVTEARKEYKNSHPAPAYTSDEDLEEEEDEEYDEDDYADDEDEAEYAW